MEPLYHTLLYMVPLQYYIAQDATYQTSICTSLVLHRYSRWEISFDTNIFSLWKSNLLNFYILKIRLWTQSLQILNIYQGHYAKIYSKILTVNKIQIFVEASCNNFLSTIVCVKTILKIFLYQLEKQNGCIWTFIATIKFSTAKPSFLKVQY